MQDGEDQPFPYRTLLAGLTALLVNNEPAIAELFTVIVKDYGAEVVLVIRDSAHLQLRKSSRK